MPDDLRPAGPPVLGYFGLTSDWRLEGWCWSPFDPAARHSIDITLNGTVVQVCAAAEFNELLKQHGHGDGHCGFSLSPPPGIGVIEDDAAVVEAREQRSGTVLGRVVFHPEQAGLGRTRRLERACAEAQVRLSAARPLPGRLAADVGTAMTAFGATLAHHAWPGAPLDALQDAKAALSRCAPLRLPRLADPELSLVMLAATDWRVTVAALRHADRVLAALGAEMILLDDGASPLTPLLPSRIEGLRLHRGTAHAAIALRNQAIAAARGSFVCLVHEAVDFCALDLPAMLRAGGGAVLAGDAAAALEDSNMAGLAHWIDEIDRIDWHDAGITLLMRRADFMRAGGLERDIDADRIAWPDFAAKLAALGIPITARRRRCAVAARLRAIPAVT